jgi:type II restriction enzyme
MDLTLDPLLGEGFKNKTQVARVVTEDWGARNLYCPACISDTLAQTRANTRAVDFQCPTCRQPYQLKSGRKWSEAKIVDAAYEAMIAAIRGDNTPNLFVMQYSTDWRVYNMLLVPRFFFTESVIEQRKPLSPSARRAGWVGCNILLNQIPPDGKLRLVSQGIAIDSQDIRRQYERIRPFASLDINLRGWTLDVLKIVRKLNKVEFTLAEVYQFEPELAVLHPDNHNIRAKIRQQLQQLRDLGFLDFSDRGKYVLRG